MPIEMQCADNLKSQSILTTAEVCKLLRRSIPSVRRYAKKGLIRAVIFDGRAAGYDTSSVFAMLEKEPLQ